MNGGLDPLLGPVQYVAQERQRRDNRHELSEPGRARVFHREIAIIRHQLVDTGIDRS